MKERRLSLATKRREIQIATFRDWGEEQKEKEVQTIRKEKLKGTRKSDAVGV